MRHFEHLDRSCFSLFTPGKFCSFKQLYGHDCRFFTADFIAYVLVCLRYTKSHMYKPRTPFWRDVFETVLQSEGLTEDRFWTAEPSSRQSEMFGFVIKVNTCIIKHRKTEPNATGGKKNGSTKHFWVSWGRRTDKNPHFFHRRDVSVHENKALPRQEISRKS